MNNVLQVTKDSLCTGCGVCRGVCPTDAIAIEIDRYGIYSPQINKQKCVDCGICLNVCPGLGIDYKKYMMKLHGKLPEDVALGPYIKSYAGYANDPDILKKSQSGGFVSSLLIYGIENGIFDGAVVTCWDEDEPFKPKVYIARTRKEILKAVGSKYNPIPVGAITKEILKLDGRYAFVGTSCQIQGMRKAEEHIGGLSEKIALYVGLHCLKVFNYYYHDQILHKIHKTKSDISYFRFRDKEWRGWPCDTLFRTKTGETINLPGQMNGWARSYFSNWRCQLCFDKLNEFSDVSCGDCRIPSHYGKETIKDAYYSGIGKSDIVIRTERADQIIQKMIDENILTLEKSQSKDLIRSLGVAEKKAGLDDFSTFIRLIGGKAPEYGVKFEVKNFYKNPVNRILRVYSVLSAGHYYICYKLMRYKLFRYILKKIPHKVLGIMREARERMTTYRRIRNYSELILVDDKISNKDIVK